MKLTKEDIKKYGTENEKKILNESFAKKHIKTTAFKEVNNFRDVDTCRSCRHYNNGWFTVPICMAVYGDMEPKTLHWERDAILSLDEENTICDLYEK